MALAALSTCAPAARAADSPEDAVRFRQGIMNAMAWNVAPLAYMVTGRQRFDDARFTVLAARTAVLATMALEGFTPDSAAARSLTSAKVWQQFDDFSQRMQALESTSSALAKAAQRGDQAQMRVLFDDTLKICKACHDEYQRTP
jgi:cytochrome c556